jgi:hypothetical protein
MDMGVNMDMDMTIFHMFRFVSKSLWVFWLNRNTETSCEKVKKQNKRLVSDSAKTNFNSSFDYIETSFEGHPTLLKLKPSVPERRWTPEIHIGV